MSEWKETKLGDVAEITSSKRIFYSEYVENGVPFYRSKEIIDLFNRRDIQTELYITEKRFKEIEEKFGVPNADDILLTSVGSLGIPYKVKPKDRFYFKDGNLTWFRNLDKKKINPDFLFTWLSSNVGKQKLDEVSIGSTQAALTISGLKTIEILLPDLKTQTAIASVLSSLDDKIDLLHRQNQTLEALAETLFKQWFVEEAKEEWESMPLSKMANFLNGLACQKFPPKNEIEKLPVLKIKELSSGITENSDWATTDVKPEYIVKNGDVIFAWSASLMVKIWNGQDCILNQHLFKVTSDNFPKWFYFLWCKHHLAEFISIAASHATTMGHIKRGDLDEAMVLIPSKHELEKMTEKVEPLIEKIITNQSQIRTLTALRDTLLPKLMSGEIRVKMG
ncbi:MAG: restriction modification system DNA specificity domain-containing protein [Bacteroidetes bacterium OLB9]|nr:MAG: restriction modification system DNA specificity domain-containing protein [Bacteroidetes bacterium OLB9]